MHVPPERNYQISHKEENNMRREFLFTNEVTIDEYMAEAAKLLRSMKFGEKLEDGSCLAEDLTEEEQAELANYIYEIAYQEMIKSAGKHCLRKCDFGEYADDFINNFAVVIMKRLHTFNDVSCLTNKGKQYKFSTFLDELSKEATRITYAQKRGVSEHVEQRIQNVRQAMRKAMAKNMVGIDAVTPEMIAAELSRYMSTDEIIDILNISRGMISVEQHNEEAGEDTDVLESAVYIDTKIFDVLEVDVEKLFDAFFSKLSDMQKFFILVYVGCDPCYYGMTADQLSADEMFVRIIEADNKFCKNVCKGTVVVERPDRRSVTGAKSMVLENVKYIKTTLIRYQRDEAKKTLATLRNGIKCSDITGECGVAYFMRQWELLKEKYTN